MRKINSKKGQLSLGDAPAVVMIVGLVFLTMATVALIGQKMGESVLTDTSASVTNESSYLNRTGDTLAGAGNLNANSFIITSAYNASSNAPLNSSQYSVNAVTGVVVNGTNTEYSTVLISYTYIYNPETVAYNTTGDLQTEISNNTSIAGIVLTISLVGIVLTILIGVFMGIQRRSRV